MTTSHKNSVMVVGAGLSGCLVALQLLKKGWDVTLMDNNKNHSSVVAAGFINPLVFRRMTKSWRLDEFTNYLIPFYQQLSADTKNNFFHPIQIRRMFSGSDERNLWLEKEGQSAYINYMVPVSFQDQAYDMAINEHGSGRVKNAFWVDTSEFILAVQSYLRTKVDFISESFDFKHLHDSNYNGKNYSNFVFCEGYLGKENPWFSYLPLTQTKGETLTIESNDLPNGESLNRKCFVLPIANNKFKIGSTYTWDTTDLTPTQEGRELILNNLSYLTNVPVKVLEHHTGIRPTTVDRRPLIGTHPSNKNYHIFNGLGAKGYMMAPLLSLEFAEYLTNGIPLDKEVNIERYIKNSPLIK